MNEDKNALYVAFTSRGSASFAMKTIPVRLTAKAIEAARQWEAKILQHINKFRRANPSGFNSPGQFFKGYLGEFAFLHFVRTYRLRHRYVSPRDGKSHPPEFTLYRAGREVTLDVKANSRPDLPDPHLTVLLYELAQQPADLYCQAMILRVADDLSFADILLSGYATREALEATEERPCFTSPQKMHALGQSQLLPMGDIIHLHDTNI